MDQSNASPTVLSTASYFQKREKCISSNFQLRRLTTKFCEFPLITGRNEVGPRVIFSQACVKNSVHRGGRVSASVHAGIHPPPPEQTPDPGEANCSIRSTSGRYASYWNAFLYDHVSSYLYLQQPFLLPPVEPSSAT